MNEWMLQKIKGVDRRLDASFLWLEDQPWFWCTIKFLVVVIPTGLFLAPVIYFLAGGQSK